jgi:hypothetical protein
VHTAALLAGLIVPQVILFGPSLYGSKLLLPLDLLAMPNYYLPRTPQYASVQPYDFALADEIVLFEFERRFAAHEFRSGRWPLWTPDIYVGAPYAVWGKYAPLNALYYLWPSPAALAWTQLLKSLIAGVGAYLFFRRGLAVSRWPATIGAWCYPLIGFFALWQGYPHSEVAAWLPWLFLAADGVARRPLSWSGPALAVLTCIVLVTRVDVAAQALLACGLFALWRLWSLYGRARNLRPLLGGAAVAAGSWLVGFLLAAPYLLPLAEYTRFGERIAQRAVGTEERPPGGLYEIPRIVLPEIYGATHWCSQLLVYGNLPESAAAAYIGFLATFVLVPMAWANRGRRPCTIFWTILCVLALAWTLNVPGVVQILRSPGLRLFSHNRLTFVAAFALLVLAVTGLESVQQNQPVRWWFAIVPIAALVGLAIWCGQRLAHLPEPLATQLEIKLRSGPASISIPNQTALEAAQAGYVTAHFQGLLFCAAALAAWLLLWKGVARFRGVTGCIGVLLIAELVYFGYGRNPQCPWSLYYPPLAVLDELAKRPGRVLGVDCLPANLPARRGLRDVRGYDSIDPHSLMKLLDSARAPANAGSAYAHVQWYHPRIELSPSGDVRLPGILDLLGVRYLIYRGRPPSDVKVFLTGDDYWVAENSRALPRCFVPRRVEISPDDDELFRRLGAASYDPHDVVYVDGQTTLPQRCEGQVAVVGELPRQVTLHAGMQTAGLVVLADLWYDGWQAECNGTPVPILRTDGALRGVMVPAGSSTIVFSYQPQSFIRGVELFVLALAILLGWAALTIWSIRRIRKLPSNRTLLT